MNARSFNQRRKIRGAAAVELAVVLPVILTLLFGIIEFGWIFMVGQTLTSAAREGCRIAVLPGAVDADITEKVNGCMQSAGMQVQDYELSITHATPADPTEVVVVTIPYSKISLVGGYFGMGDRNLQGYAAMRKEGH